MNRLKIEEFIVKTLIYISSAVVVASLFAIVIVVVWRGARTLSLSMIFSVPQGGFYLGKEGGVLNAILGSLYIAGGATLLSFLAGLPIAIYLQDEYIGRTRFAEVVRLVFDVLFGIPSIVYGALGFTLMVFLGLRASLLAGMITVTLLELPIMVRGMDETLRMIPPDLKEASLSVGASKFETFFKVGVRQTMPGIITAVVIAFGRGIGDAASVLFTAGFSDNIPTSLFQPVATLPLAIFFQLGTPFHEVQERAYASAIILLGLILILMGIAAALNRIFAKYTVR